MARYYRKIFALLTGNFWKGNRARGWWITKQSYVDKYLGALRHLGYVRWWMVLRPTSVRKVLKDRKKSMWDWRGHMSDCG